MLKSNLVILRRYSLEDAPKLYEAISISVERVYLWLPWCHPNYTLEETKTWLQTKSQRWNEGKEFGFSIRDFQNRIVGGCGIGIESIPLTLKR